MSYMGNNKCHTRWNGSQQSNTVIIKKHNFTNDWVLPHSSNKDVSFPPLYDPPLANVGLRCSVIKPKQVRISILLHQYH